MAKSPDVSTAPSIRRPFSTQLAKSFHRQSLCRADGQKDFQPSDHAFLRRINPCRKEMPKTPIPLISSRTTGERKILTPEAKLLKP
jgi:hypothetical protein